MAALPTHLWKTLTLGLPLIGSSLAQILIGLTDTLMLGRYSVEALAAGVLGHTFFFTLFLLGGGFAFGMMGVSADAAGRGDERAVRRAARMGLWLSLAAGVVLMVPMWFSEAVLLVLRQEATVAADAQAYLRIALVGLIPALLTATLRSHLSALERTGIVLAATLAAGAMNVALNWVFIFGNLGAPEMGIRGAALASVAVHVATTLFLVLYAAGGPGMARWELFRNLHRPDWSELARLFRVGWPVGLTLVSESSLFAASALMMGAIGTEALAAHGIAMQVAAATFMVHLGLSQAATVRVGRYAGQGDAADLRRAAVASLLWSGVAVALSMAMYFTFAERIVLAFLDVDDPQAPAILLLGIRLLMIAAVFQFVDAAQVMALGLLRGLQDTRRPMIYAALSYWAVGIPVSWLLGFVAGLGAEGIWVGLVVGLACAATSLMVRFWRMAPLPAVGAATA